MVVLGVHRFEGVEWLLAEIGELDLTRRDAPPPEILWYPLDAQRSAHRGVA